MNWITPSTLVDLYEQEAHIWWIDVDSFIHKQSQIYPLLSSIEQEKAHRFYFPKDRQQYIVIHGICRLILAHYLRCSPRAIQYGEEQNGKPIIVSPEVPPIQFNLSHSATKAILAVSLYQVGIDVEQMNTTIPLHELISQFMSSDEQQTFIALSQQEQPLAFYRCWTRKEAYVKAIGQGLSYPIRQVEVSLNEQPILLDSVDRMNEQRWQLLQLPQMDDYLISFVTEQQPLRFSLFRYTESLFSGYDQ